MPLRYLPCEEVIDGENQRRIVHTFSEIEIVLNVPAEGDGKEIEVGHQIEGSNALFAQGCGGGFGLQGGPL
jgi:hypothetical protein